MCGVYGLMWAKRPSSFTRQNVGNLIALNHALASGMAQRGTDSYGMVALDEGAVRVVRGMGDIRKSLRAVDLPVSFDAVLGHTRYATVGEVVMRNTHPFAYGDIIGMHNGGVWDDHAKGYTCDSMSLIDRISKGGDVDFVGYGVSQWVDENSGEVYLCRMDVIGDLEMASVKVGNGGRLLVWASNFRPVRNLLQSSNSSLVLKDMPILTPGRVYRMSEGGPVGTTRTVKAEYVSRTYWLNKFPGTEVEW